MIFSKQTIVFVLISTFIFFSCSVKNENTAESAEQTKTDSIVNSDDAEVNEIPVGLSALNESDSLARVMIDDENPMREIEHMVHTLIWGREEIRAAAKTLQDKNVISFTMTDEIEQNGEDSEADLYTVSFYQLLPEHYHRMETFRVNLPSNTIEKLNVESGEWKIVNE